MAKNVRKLQLEIDRGLKQTDEVSFHPPAPPLNSHAPQTWLTSTPFHALKWSTTNFGCTSRKVYFILALICAVESS